jgi:hypothetical protein
MAKLAVFSKYLSQALCQQQDPRFTRVPCNQTLSQSLQIDRLAPTLRGKRHVGQVIPAVKVVNRGKQSEAEGLLETHYRTFGRRARQAAFRPKRPLALHGKHDRYGLLNGRSRIKPSTCELVTYTSRSAIARMKAGKYGQEVCGNGCSADKRRPHLNGRLFHQKWVESDIIKIVVEIVPTPTVLGITRSADAWTTLAPMADTANVLAPWICQKYICAFVPCLCGPFQLSCSSR